MFEKQKPFESELEKFGADLVPVMTQFEQVKHQKVEQVLHRCLFDSHSQTKGLTEFVDCMMIRSKSINKQLKLFNFKMVFIQDSTYKCFQNGQNSKDYDICKQIGRDTIYKFQEQFAAEVDKL